MSFGGKLLQLRKREGMSQEALAEKLHTSRQAISKWENDQGYPETEKIIILSNIFSVSTDYLLKDSQEIVKADAEGFFVSQETAEGYLRSQRKEAKYVAFGVSMFISAFLPYLLLRDSFSYYFVIIGLMVTVGVGGLLIASVAEEEYAYMKKEVLLFDEKYMKQLKSEYASLKRKYMAFCMVGFCSSFFGSTLLLFVEKGIVHVENTNVYYAISVVFILAGAYLFIYFVSIIYGYEFLIKNEVHTNKLFFKLQKKFEEKKRKL